MRKSKKNSPDGSLRGEELFKSIGEACKGLIYTSETDAAVLPFVLEDDPTKDDIVLEKLGAKAAHSVETYSLEEFFNRLTKKREWFGPAEIAMADKFARLQSLLQENLIDLKMVRTGTVRVTIVIAGRDAEGRLMGIRTEAVET